MNTQNYKKKLEIEEYSMKLFPFLTLFIADRHWIHEKSFSTYFSGLTKCKEFTPLQLSVNQVHENLSSHLMI